MKKLLSILAIPLAVFSAGVAHSQNLVLQTNVGAAAFFDDQFALQTGAEDAEVYSLGYLPSMNLSYGGEIYQSTLSANGGYNWYFDSQRGDVRNYALGWVGSRAGQRSLFEWDFEHGERFLENVVELDGSELSSSETIKFLSSDFNFSRNLSSRTSAVAGYRYLTNESESSIDRNEDENEVHYVDLGIETAFSPRTTLGLYADLVAFRPDQDGRQPNAESYGLAIGGTFDLGERWTAGGIVGAGQVNFDADPATGVEEIVGDGDVVLQADVNAEYLGLRDSLAFSLSSQTFQTLDGVIDEQQQARVGWSRGLTESLAMSLNALAFKADRNDRSFYSVNAALNWRPSLRWNYRFAYQFRQEETTSLDLNGVSTQLGAESNRLTVTVTYTFQDLTW